MENREKLIEWVEKNWCLIPHDIAAMRTFALPINQQKTFILRIIKQHTLDRA